jgi:hypothetical protein
MAEARAHLVEVTRAATDHALTARHAATMARVAQDRLARLEHALAELPDVAAIKKKSGARDATPRVSTTDPDARVMKMPGGGFRPAPACAPPSCSSMVATPITTPSIRPLPRA